MFKTDLSTILVLVGAFTLQACSAGSSSINNANAQVQSVASKGDFQMPDKETLKNNLTPLQYRVTQEDGTERAFDNEYWDNHEHGIYVDVVSGRPLFSSLDKYDSGSGWPSFTQPLDSEEIVEKRDFNFGMVRTEVRSSTANSHLGHVFDDGPRDRGGLRYCINSAAMRFVPVAEMASQGYSDLLQPFVDQGLTEQVASTAEVAYLAGGCFWGMEEIIRAIPGVLNTDVGYTGGNFKYATYDDVKRGNTGHAESIKVEFDPAVLSFEVLLRDWFFKMHDPTTENRQGNDIGSQYRSAIFYRSDEQKAVAARVIQEVDAAGKWPKPIVTEVTEAGDFWVAESSHQDYLQKFPNGYTCHWLRD